MMPAITLFLALVLAASAAHKLMDRPRATLATVRLTGVPSPLGMALVLSAATYEGLAALALAMAPFRQEGAIAATALWTVYALALLRLRGQVLDCGCDFIPREKAVDAVAILRPALLALLALWVATASADPFSADAPFAALALLSLWFAASELAALPSRTRLHSGRNR